MTSVELINGHARSQGSGQRRIPNFRLRSDPMKLAGAALEQFSRNTFERTRMEDVARRLGLSKTAVYMHFSSKRALFDRVIEEFCLTGEWEGGDPWKALKRLLSLSSQPAAMVLRIVLREWASMPGIGAQYLEAVAAKLASQPGIADAEAARRLATSVLAPVTIGILFSPDPPADREG